MKKLFNLILWIIVFNSTSIAALAQDNSSCYMLDENGDSLDLGHLCQNSSPSKTRRPNKNFVDPYTYRNPYQKTAGVQVVPIKRRRSGIPVIDVKFNNRYVFEMMLDTGASAVVITQQMAKKLNVNHSETIWVSTPSSRYFRMPAGYVYSIGVGKLTQKNTRVITSSSMDMGLLGQSFFSQYDITIKRDVVEFRER